MLVCVSVLYTGSNMAALVEEEETAAGWRNQEMMETGPNQCHETSALNSESVLVIFMRAILEPRRAGEFDG